MASALIEMLYLGIVVFVLVSFCEFSLEILVFSQRRHQCLLTVDEAVVEFCDVCVELVFVFEVGDGCLLPVVGAIVGVGEFSFEGAGEVGITPLKVLMVFHVLVCSWCWYH